MNRRPLNLRPVTGPRLLVAGGFTLIELMVVVGIIALLATLTVVGMSKMRKTAARNKTALDMQSISMVLEEYKRDRGEYPQVAAENTGFAVLVRELIGPFGDGVTGAGPPPPPDPYDPPAYDGSKEYRPGDCVGGGTGPFHVCLETNTGQPVGNSRYWAPFNPRDGLDGPGTRSGGQKRPNYLQPEKFRIRGCAIVDANDQPILYFPARGNPNVNKPGPGGGSDPSYVALAGGAKYHVSDNWQFFTREDDQTNTGAEDRVQSMMGDLDQSGIIEPATETAAATAGFVLWSAGPDGFFGPVGVDANAITAKDVSRCDDVTSFQQ